MEEFVNLRPSVLDRHGWFVPFVEFWTAEKLPWGRPWWSTVSTLPPHEEVAALIEHYSAR